MGVAVSRSFCCPLFPRPSREKRHVCLVELLHHFFTHTTPRLHDPVIDFFEVTAKRHPAAIDLIDHETFEIFDSPDEVRIASFNIPNIVVILVEQIHPVVFVVSPVVKNTTGRVDEETVPTDEIGALEKTLEKKAAETIDARFFKRARELALAAQTLQFTTVNEPGIGDLYLRSAHIIPNLH